MNYYVYFPQDLLKKHLGAKPCNLVGYHYNNIYIVISITGISAPSTLNFPFSENLKVVGTLNAEKAVNEYLLNVLLHKKWNYPVLNNPQGQYTIVLFDPPNFRNLEYFSIKPILLQSTGQATGMSNESALLNKLNQFEPLNEKSDLYSISDDVVLDKLNQCLRIRQSYDHSIAQNSSQSKLSNNRVVKLVKSQVFDIFKMSVMLVQYFTIWLIRLINYKVLAHSSLTDISETFKQLDLRLRQINYFPIQFLCYYDKSILYNKNSQFLQELEVPFLNSDLNINNSNYINLYNSLWLIINDVLMGITVHRLIVDNYETLFRFVNDTIIRQTLFSRLYDLIEWVSFHHPAGFKLNNELGQFMGDLFLWTLKFWKMVFADGLMSSLADNAHLSFSVYYHRLSSESLFFRETYSSMAVILMKLGLKCMCYGGVTFLLSAIVDYVRVITFHLYSFYYTSTKIYHRQVESIKSLFQLFRGKKYNVLRDRIDSLDLTDRFEIDQLLLGTLLFMILIYLLPTVFAFYMMFFIIRLMVLSLNNLIESVVTFINFIPLFIVLLKFKNSNRLQGGITFNYLFEQNGASYISLLNKSLSYNEIFKNFFKLFKVINFKNNIFRDFSVGNLVFLNDLKPSKYNYLMLPKNYSKTVDLWDLFSKEEPEASKIT